MNFNMFFGRLIPLTLCLIHLTDYIKLENDKGNFTGMVLLDIQIAFGAVNHAILFNKLKWLGADNVV